MTEINKTRDHKLLAQLNKEVQDLHHTLYPAIFKPHDREGIAVFFKKILEDDTTKAFVALQEGQVAGYALAFIKESPETAFQYASKYLLLDQLLVVEKYRGTGLGGLLLDEIHNLAKEFKISRIQLSHWTNNEQAKRFFGKKGFDYHLEHMFKEI